MGRCGLASAVIAAGVCLSCGGGDPTEVLPGDVTKGCVPGQLELADGQCIDAGTQANGCAAGETPLAGGGCVPAGVPPEECGLGFSADGHGGCIPVLPREPCAPGLIALPGDGSCREVAPCGASPWGDIVIDDNTVFVDGAYALNDSDGSQNRPWRTIQQAIVAAAPGDTVAVAAGSYEEDVVIQDKAVNLYARCPALVEIVGTGAGMAALLIGAGASGTELGGIAIRGPGIGLISSAAEDVLVDRVWIHDTADIGIDFEDALGPSSVTVRDSLVEASREAGVLLVGASASIETTVVRDTRAQAGISAGGAAIAAVQSQQGARSSITLRHAILTNNQESALYATSSDVTVEESLIDETQPASSGLLGVGIWLDPRSTGNVRSSVINRNRTVGMAIIGAEAVVDRGTVRGTQCQSSGDFGRGIETVVSPGGEPSTLYLRASLVEQNSDVGVAVGASDATIESTIIRATQPRLVDQAFGTGLSFKDSDLHRPAGVVRWSVVENNHDSGIHIEGSDVNLEGCVVRDMNPQIASQKFGRGINVQHGQLTAAPASVTVVSSVVDRAMEAGVMLLGSSMVLEGSVVRGTRPRPFDQFGGMGMEIARFLDSPLRSVATIRGSVVESCSIRGIGVFGGDVDIVSTVVRDIGPDAVQGLFGDGIDVVSDPELSTAVVARSRFEGIARAGIMSFGARVELGGTQLECNAIHLGGEVYLGTAHEFLDRGTNVCGCGETRETCSVRSTGLEPPSQLEP